MKKLKIAVVGAGGMIGGRRVNYYKQNPNAELVAVCEFPKERAEEVAKKAGVKDYYSDWREMLKVEEIEAVNVSTPNIFHYEISKAALKAGKHVSTEYPVCQSAEEYDDLVNTAKQKGLIFHDALTVRVEPQHVKIRENLPKIGAPVCGRMNFFGGPSRWYIDPKVRGHMFLCYHIHYIDQFLDLFGDVAWVDASQFVIKEKNVHAGTIMMGHKSGAVSYIEFGMGFPVSSAPHTTIRGTEGILRYITEAAPPVVQLINKDGKTDFVIDKETMKWTTDVTKVAIKEHSDNFVEEALEGKPSLNPLDIGRRAIEVTLMAEKSAVEGKRLTI